MKNEMRNHINTMRNEHYFLPVNRLAFKLKIRLYLGQRANFVENERYFSLRLYYIFVFWVWIYYFIDKNKKFLESQVYNLVQRMCVVICRELLG